MDGTDVSATATTPAEAFGPEEIIDRLQTAVQHSGAAVSALSELSDRLMEMNLRVARLREWWEFERILRDLVSTFQEFNHRVKIADRSPERWTDERMEHIEFLWGQCKGRYNELSRLRPQVSGSDRADGQIEQWIRVIEASSNALQNNLDQQALVPLAQNSIKFWDLLNGYLIDSRTIMGKEIQDMNNLAIRLNSRREAGN